MSIRSGQSRNPKATMSAARLITLAYTAMFTKFMRSLTIRTTTTIANTIARNIQSTDSHPLSQNSVRNCFYLNSVYDFSPAYSGETKSGFCKRLVVYE